MGLPTKEVANLFNLHGRLSKKQRAPLINELGTLCWPCPFPGEDAALMRIWEKRRAGYRAMGYRLTDSGQTMALR